MAPEVVDGKHGKATYSTSADVYSFGVVMSELATRQLPFSELSGPNWELQNAILEGRRPQVDEDGFEMVTRKGRRRGR